MSKYYEYIRWSNESAHHPTYGYSFLIPDTVDKDTSFEIKYANRNTWANPFYNENRTGFWGNVRSNGTLDTNYFADSAQVGASGSATIKYDRNKYYVNGTLVKTCTEISTSTTGIIINNSEYGDNANSIDIYYVKVWQNDVLTRDLIPCLNDSNEKGFYDTVSKTFFKDLKGTATLYNQLFNVTASGVGGTVTGTGAYQSGSSVTLTATPDSGYKFNRWKLNGYTRIEYIQSTGTQYIDTGIPASADMGAFIDFQCTNQSTSQQALFGARTGTASQNFVAFTGMSTSTLQIDYGSDRVINHDTPITGLDLNTRTTIEVINKVATVNGNYVATGSTAPTGQTTRGIMIFANNNSGSIQLKSSIKLYGFKLYQSDTLVADMVPVIRESDNEAGLLDLLEFKFYGNNGSGTFTAGDEISDGVIFTDNPLTFTVNSDVDFTIYFDRTSNCFIKVNGEWKQGMLYRKDNTWKETEVFVKNGTWKK